MKRGVLLVLVIALVWGIALAQTLYLTKENYPASASRTYLDKFVEYSVAKDYAATQKLLDSGLVILLKPGIEVYLVETKLWSGVVKIRPKGYTQEFWTLSEAIYSK